MEARDKKAKVFLVVPSECAWNTGEIDQKNKPKQQMYVKTIHVHKTYAILWRKHGKNMFKLESYKPISRSI